MALRKHLIQTSKFLLIETSPNITFPYVRFPKSLKQEFPIQFVPDKTLKDLRDQLCQVFDSPDVKFFGIDGSKYSLSTLSLDAIIDPLVVQIEEGPRFSLFSLNSDRTNLTPEQRNLAKYYEQQLKMTFDTAQTLSCINSYIHHELTDFNGTINKATFSSIAKSAVLFWSNQIRVQKNHLRTHLQTIKTNFAWELGMKQILEKAAEKHANRVLWGFFSIIAVQYAGVQYGTYHLYSWDVMEPVTCMMSMGDACIGYLFWMLAGHREYGMSGIKDYFYQKKLRKLYKKKRINQEEIENVAKIIEDLSKKIEINE